jgi:hypothetical protein
MEPARDAGYRRCDLVRGVSASGRNACFLPAARSQAFRPYEQRQSGFEPEVDMSISSILGRSVIALTIAVVPAGGAFLGLEGIAYAKGGNGNGNSGGGNGNGGGNGGGNGNSGGNRGNGGGGNHAGGNSEHGKKSDTVGSHGSHAKSKDDTRRDHPTLKSFFTHEKKAATTTRTRSATTTRTKAAKSEFAGLNSLNRNYHAYLHSNDPRMAAVSAYVMAYAEFEAENGPDAIPTDPALSDEALREALSSFTKGGEVSDGALERAKDILGVGPAVGKIDQVRDTLPVEEPAPEPVESAPVEDEAPPPPVTVIVEQT